MKGEERGHKRRGDRGGSEGEGKSTVGCFRGQRENFSKFQQG